MGGNNHCSISHAIDVPFSKCGDCENGMFSKKGSNIEVEDITKSIIDLSLTYVVVRGYRFGRISNTIDSALQVKHKQDQIVSYIINAIIGTVDGKDLGNRKLENSTRWDQRKKQCANPQCSSLAHFSYGVYCI